MSRQGRRPLSSRPSVGDGWLRRAHPARRAGPARTFCWARGTEFYGALGAKAAKYRPRGVAKIDTPDSESSSEQWHLVLLRSDSRARVGQADPARRRPGSGTSESGTPGAASFARGGRRRPPGPRHSSGCAPERDARRQRSRIQARARSGSRQKNGALQVEPGQAYRSPVRARDVSRICSAGMGRPAVREMRGDCLGAAGRGQRRRVARGPQAV